MKKHSFAAIIVIAFAHIQTYGQSDKTVDGASENSSVDGYPSFSVETIDETPRTITETVERIGEPDTTSAMSLPVGGIKSSFSVSDLGAATYSIHIDVPEGIKGMTPDINIVYNSQSGNNIAGWGFGLSTASSISFVNKDIYHDGQAKGLQYDWTDGLSLDGKRMRLKSGTAGSAGAIYDLEGDPYTKITLQIHPTNNRPYFLVEAPDGMRYTYGKFDALQTITVGGVEKYVAWYLYEAYDRHWNKISYGYQIDNNHYYPSTIYYSDCAVRLQYEDRSNDIETYYIGSSQAQMARRLKTVTVKKRYTNDVYRTYTLSYDTTSDQSGTKYSRLVSVTEANGNGETLQPMTIEWNHLPGFGINAELREYEKMGVEDYYPVKNRQYSATDVNGDGISDLVYVYNVKISDSSTGQLYKTYVFTALSNKSSSGEITYNWWRQFITNSTYSIGDKRNNFSFYNNGTLQLDIEGDGKNDILLSNIDSWDNNIEHAVYTVLTGDFVTSGSVSSIFPYIPLNCHYKATAPIYTYSDFDNDGKTEIVHIETGKSEGVYKGYYLYNTASSLLQGVLFNLSLPSNPTHIFCGDYNNDGLTDIALFCTSGYKVFFNRGMQHGTFPFDDSSSFTGTDIHSRDRMESGDFNGDGLPDFIMKGNTSSNYYILTGNGDGSFAQSASMNLGAGYQSTDDDTDHVIMLPIDLDHDSKTDMLVGKAFYKDHGWLQHDTFKYSEFCWLHSTGSGFELMRKTRTNNKNDTWPAYLFTGDFTGNGKTEIMNYGNDIYSTSVALNTISDLTENNEDEYDDSSSLIVEDKRTGGFDTEDENTAISSSRESVYDTFHLYAHSGINAASGRVTRVGDAFGKGTEISYSNLTNSGIYTEDRAFEYPLNGGAIPLSVVDNYTEDDGTAAFASSSIRYNNLRWHVSGRGLIGFTSILTTDNISGTQKTDSIESLDSIRFCPLSRITKTKNGNYLSSTRINYSLGNVGGQYKYYPANNITTDIYGHTTKHIMGREHLTGALGLDYTIYDGDNNMVKEIDYESHVYKGGAYHPTLATTYSLHTDTQYEETVTQTTYQYDTYGDVTKLTELYDTPLSHTTEYTYDSYGNVQTCRKQTGTDKYLTTTYAYENGKDLASKTTTPATATHTYTYNIWGLPLTHTEAYGDTIRTTVNIYDNWGNLRKTVSPEGVETTYTRGWGTAPDKKYYILERRQGAPWVKTWYDCRGREVLVESIGPDHVRHDKYTYYDTQGRVSGKKEVLGACVREDTISYDILGRVTSERHTAGGNTTYTYGDRTVTSQCEGITLTKTFDAWGNVSGTVENGTAVSYLYAPNGKPREISSCGNTVTMEYDVAGNRTSLTDPDAGTSTWEYDVNGRVTRHTDPRGKVTAITYDALGNKQTETVDGVVHRYYYDTPGERLMRELKPGFVRRYKYDGYGREITFGTYISGEQTLFKTTAYDQYGRVLRENYPYTVNIGSYYDEYGYKTRSTVNNNTVWRLAAFDGLNTREYTLSDSILTHKRTNVRGDMLGQSVRVTGTQGGPDLTSPIDTMAYYYYQGTNNLYIDDRHLADGTRIIRNHFYDSLDRLIETRELGDPLFSIPPRQVTYTYSADGNITKKSDIGNYTYGGSKPHAVTGVQNSMGLISSSPQSVTYNLYGKVDHVEGDGYSLNIEYGTDRQRWRSTLSDSLSNQVRRVRYFPGMDIVTEGGSTRLYLYADGGTVYVREVSAAESASSVYHRITDRLGNTVSIVRGDGSEVLKARYDEWGKMTCDRNDIGFIRGFTGHETLSELGLINMNGRMFDPFTARFLSPDDYVQAPLSPQGFNRYSYCMNNPLRYTDPSGELFGWGHAIVAAFSFASGYLSNSIATGNWGWISVKHGLLSAAASVIGYKVPSTNVTGHMWSYIGKNAANNFINNVIPHQNITINPHLAFSANPMVCFSGDVLTVGLGARLSYQNNSFSFGIGGGVTNYYTLLSSSIGLGRNSISYSSSTFKSGDFYGNLIDSQRVGTIRYDNGENFSFSFSNDYFGDREDRWRTTAAEMRINNISTGIIIGTNYGKKDSNGESYEYKSPIAGKFERWAKDYVYTAPLWIGLINGNQIFRYGYNADVFQDATQNVLHKLMYKINAGTAKYYMTYSYMQKGMYSYSGFYNPDVIWAH